MERYIGLTLVAAIAAVAAAETGQEPAKPATLDVEWQRPAAVCQCDHAARDAELSRLSRELSGMRAELASIKIALADVAANGTPHPDPGTDATTSAVAIEPRRVTVSAGDCVGGVCSPVQATTYRRGLFGRLRR